MLDYRRIYREFIEDRRIKESSLVGYSESHHILPRSLGGGDEPDNLISLTPEDHYFAHLLLAKIHGGSQWSSVWLMSSMGKTPSRASYGLARRNYSLYVANEVQDQTFYEIRHVDGRCFLGRRIYLSRRTGIDMRLLGKLVTGEIKSRKGWYLPHINRDGVYRYKAPDEKEYTIRNFDGREVTGVRTELVDKAGIPRSSLYNIISGRHKTSGGWFLPDMHGGEEPEKPTCNKPDKTFYEIRNYDGRVFLGRRPYLRYRTGLCDKKIAQLVNEKNHSHKGWYIPHKKKRRKKKSIPECLLEPVEFVNIRTNVELTIPPIGICERHSIPRHSMLKMMKGSQGHVRGWVLKDRVGSISKKSMAGFYSVKNGDEQISGSLSDVARGLGLSYGYTKRLIGRMRNNKCFTYKGWSLAS